MQPATDTLIIHPFTQEHLKEQRKKFNVGEDCPVFQGMYPYCQVLPSLSTTVQRARCLYSQEWQAGTLYPRSSWFPVAWQDGKLGKQNSWTSENQQPQTWVLRQHCVGATPWDAIKPGTSR